MYLWDYLYHSLHSDAQAVIAEKVIDDHLSE